MPAKSVFKTILVATDFSENADGAIAWGAELATAHRARLVLFHSLMPAAPTAPAPEFVPIPEQFQEELRVTAHSRLVATADALRAKGLAVESDLAIGPSAASILDAAARWRADLLIAGTRGLTGWKRIALGSTAALLARDATCPLLTIHPSDVGRQRPLHTVLVPTDFSLDAMLAIDAAQRLSSVFNGGHRLVLMHAYHVPIEFVAPLPAPVLLDDARRIAAVARQEIENLAERAQKNGGRVETIVCEGYPPEAIVHQATELGADLIAMGTHGRSGLKRLLLGSTAERVMSIAPCPVLTVHRPRS